MDSVNPLAFKEKKKKNRPRERERERGVKTDRQRKRERGVGGGGGEKTLGDLGRNKRKRVKSDKAHRWR